MFFSSAFQGPQHMLSSPLDQHILDYDPSRDFSISSFAMYDGSSDSYDHMLHFNQAMILNAENDRILCKVFPISLKGPALAWFLGRVRLPVSVLSQGEKEYQLSPGYPQTGRQIHPGLHTQVRTSCQAD